MLRAFINFNVRLADKVERWTPAHFRRSLLYLHEQRMGAALGDDAVRLVLDIGGGHLCPFAAYRPTDRPLTIIAMDIDEAQVRANRAVDARVVGDATRGLPVAATSVDLISTRSVLEHLSENGRFFAECHQVLRDGGRMFHVFPCKWAPFSLINRLLPARLSQWLVHTLFPQWRSECGFRAYYEDCTPAAMRARMVEAGFAVETMELRYYQSIYFKFFLPLYLLSLVYDLVVWRLNVQPVAAQALTVARKIEAQPG